MAHRETHEVTFGDVDMMGHVNHARYFTYFETARTNYLLRLKGLRPPYEAAQLDIIVARATCDYRRGLRWGERVTTLVWPSRIGATSYSFSYAIVDAGDAVVALGETVQVAFDYATNQKKPIPPDLRRALEADLKAGPGIPLPA